MERQGVISVLKPIFIHLLPMLHLLRSVCTAHAWLLCHHLLTSQLQVTTGLLSMLFIVP